MKRAKVTTTAPTAEVPLLMVRDWGRRFENNRTRELRNLAWLPEPTDLSSDLYAAILDHPDGAAHFGVSVALHIVASKTTPRGYLRRDDGRAHDAKSLARVTRIAQSVLDAAIPRLLEIGDLERQTRKTRKAKAVASHHDAASPQEGAALPHQGAALPQLKGRERREPSSSEQKEGKEGKERARDFSAGQDSAAKQGRTQSFSVSLDDDGTPENPENPSHTGGAAHPTPLDEGTRVVFATPADELKALVLRHTGRPIRQSLLDHVRSQMGGDVTAAFVDELRSHNGNFRNYAGFVRKLAGDRSRPASPPVTAAQAARENYKCSLCHSTNPKGGVTLVGGKAVPCSCASPDYIADLIAKGVIGANTAPAPANGGRGG